MFEIESLLSENLLPLATASGILWWTIFLILTVKGFGCTSAIPTSSISLLSLSPPVSVSAAAPSERKLTPSKRPFLHIIQSYIHCKNATLNVLITYLGSFTLLPYSILKSLATRASRASETSMTKPLAGQARGPT